MALKTSFLKEFLFNNLSKTKTINMKKLYLSFLLVIGLGSMMRVSEAQQPYLKSSTVVIGDLLDADTGSDFTGVIYTRSGNIYYNQMDLNGEWLGEVLLGVGTEGKIAIDVNAHPHVVYTTSGKIGYRMFDGTIWTTEVLIESNNGGTCSKPDIDVDGNGKAHITYTDTMGNTHWYSNKPDIMYTNNISGDFEKNLIFDGYYENTGGSGYIGSYFNKGSLIAVDSNGNYFIIAHNYSYYKPDMQLADKNYSIQVKSNLGTGGTSSSSSDVFNIFDLNIENELVIAMYQQSALRTSELSVASNIISFTNTQDVTATSVSSFASNGTNRVIGGKSSTNLLTLYNDFSHAYTDVVVKGVKVSVVGLNGTFYAFYTDNADGAVKMCEVAQPLSLMSFSLAEETAPAVVSIKDATISVKVPQGTDLTGLVPTFTTTTDVESIKIGAVDQISGSSSVDFSSLVTYALNSAGDSRNWTVTVSFDVPNSINEFASASVRLFPNPFSETVNITGSDLVKRVEVKNLLGQTLIESKSGNIETIHTSLLDKGVYLFVIELTNGEKVVQKMQKQ